MSDQLNKQIDDLNAKIMRLRGIVAQSHKEKNVLIAEIRQIKTIERQAKKQEHLELAQIRKNEKYLAKTNRLMQEYEPIRLLRLKGLSYPKIALQLNMSVSCAIRRIKRGERLHRERERENTK